MPTMASGPAPQSHDRTRRRISRHRSLDAANEVFRVFRVPCPFEQDSSIVYIYRTWGSRDQRQSVVVSREDLRIIEVAPGRLDRFGEVRIALRYRDRVLDLCE